MLRTGIWSSVRYRRKALSSPTLRFPSATSRPPNQMVATMPSIQMPVMMGELTAISRLAA